MTPPTTTGTSPAPAARNPSTTLLGAGGVPVEPRLVDQDAQSLAEGRPTHNQAEVLGGDLGGVAAGRRALWHRSRPPMLGDDVKVCAGQE